MARHRNQPEICGFKLSAPVVITKKGPMTSYLVFGETLTYEVYRNGQYQSYVF